MGRENSNIIVEADDQEAVLFYDDSNNTSFVNGDHRQLPYMLALNHVSFVCKSVRRSVEFYQEVLGFVLIKRPSSFNFEGAWLFNHGIGIHLLASESFVPTKTKKKINPKDNHISFQCSDMDLIIHQLEEMEIEYVKAVVRDDGITVDQIFFHDPDGYMIEICNCQNLPILPISSTGTFPLKKVSSHNLNSTYGKVHCSEEEEALMMANLTLDMMDIFI